MKSQIFYIYACFLFFIPLFGESIHPAKKEMYSLHPNSLIIYELPQSIIAVHVKKRDSSEILIEVTTAAKDLLTRENLPSWMAWCRAGMPSATSSEEVSLFLSNNAHTQGTPQPNWLSTLLSLDVAQVAQAERKKAGPPPMPEEIDLRPIWQPKITVEGKKRDAESTVYKVIWPDDGSALAKRELILYFPDTQEAVQGLPYWIESPSSSYKVFVVDSTQSFL